MRIRRPNDVVNQVSGTVVTDSRNVFDKLETEVLVVRGAQKRTDIELMALKQAQLRNHVSFRWVHSEAQLANRLTKGSEMRQLLLYYEMGQSWRIVEDPSGASARRRRLQGLDPLANGNSDALDTTTPPATSSTPVSSGHNTLSYNHPSPLNPKV